MPLTSWQDQGLISFPSDLYSLDSEHFCHLWLFFEFPVLGRAEASAYLLVTTSEASVKGKDFNCWLVLMLLLSSSSWLPDIDYLHLLLLLSFFLISWYWPFSVVDLGFLLIAAAPTLLLYNWGTQELPAGKKIWNCFSGKKNWKDRMFCNEAKVWLVRQEKCSARFWKRCW